MKSIAAPVIFLAMSAALAPAFGQTPRGAADNNSALNGRLERLEEQVADLQGVVAAVETLAKNSGGGGGYSAAAGGGASSEQVRQLSEQIAELTRRLQRLESRLGSNTGPGAEEPREQTGFNTTTPASGFEDKEQLPPLNAPQAEADRYASRPAYGAPSQQVASASQSAAQPRSYGADPYSSAPAASPAPRPTPAAVAPTASSAKALFDQAYAAYGRREYSAAETYFQQFMDQYPKDAMAGSAQYWLGETAFSSGEYRAAADRFLKTFTNFPNNERAPEALLKLAISLRRLGENAAACDSFAELQRRYPQSPKTVLQRADVEKKRANCT
jgi:tol-pal system protein YbgF